MAMEMVKGMEKLLAQETVMGMAKETAMVMEKVTEMPLCRQASTVQQRTCLRLALLLRPQVHG